MIDVIDDASKLELEESRTRELDFVPSPLEAFTFGEPIEQVPDVMPELGARPGPTLASEVERMSEDPEMVRTLVGMVKDFDFFLRSASPMISADNVGPRDLYSAPPSTWNDRATGKLLDSMRLYAGVASPHLRLRDDTGIEDPTQDKTGNVVYFGVHGLGNRDFRYFMWAERERFTGVANNTRRYVEISALPSDKEERDKVLLKALNEPSFAERHAIEQILELEDNKATDSEAAYIRSIADRRTFRQTADVERHLQEYRARSAAENGAVRSGIVSRAAAALGIGRSRAVAE